jgi:hypothetical protein
VPNVEQLIRQRIRLLDEIPREPLADEALRERAREAVRGLLGGEATVVEESDGVYAEVDFGRVYITDGAGRGT